jgi:hypothetical protein
MNLQSKGKSKSGAPDSTFTFSSFNFALCDELLRNLCCSRSALGDRPVLPGQNPQSENRNYQRLSSAPVMLTRIIMPYRIFISEIARAAGFTDQCFRTKKEAEAFVREVRRVDQSFNPSLRITFRYYDTATGNLYANRSEYEAEEDRRREWMDRYEAERATRRTWSSCDAFPLPHHRC